jgi:hypothetical protein
MSAAPRRAEAQSTLPLWFSLLAGPLAWTAHLLLSYALVAVACATGQTIILHAVTALTLAPTAWAGVVGYRAWKEHRNGERGGSRSGAGYRPFMALSGVLSSALFFYVILLEGLPVVLVSPCW